MLIIDQTFACKSFLGFIQSYSENTRVETSMRTYLLLEMNNAHEKRYVLLFFRDTLAVVMVQLGR